MPTVNDLKACAGAKKTWYGNNSYSQGKSNQKNFGKRFAIPLNLTF